MKRDDWVTSGILRFFTSAIVSPMPAPVAGAGVLFCNRMLKNKYQAVSQGDYWLEARRLERQEAKKRQKRFCFKLPGFPAFYLQT
jgi:hypothetical protein